MKLCPKAEALREKYRYVTGEEVRSGPSQEMTAKTWGYTDRRAFARAMHDHIRQCKMCSR